MVLQTTTGQPVAGITQTQTSITVVASQGAAVSRFVPHETLAILGAQDITSIGVGANTLKRLTVIFASLNGFDEISSKLSLDETLKYLNAWLERVVPDILSRGGMVDKLMGDTILVFFQDARKAMASCLSMFQTTGWHNVECWDTGGEPMKLDIGMNTGLSFGLLSLLGLCPKVKRMARPQYSVGTSATISFDFVERHTSPIRDVLQG